MSGKASFNWIDPLLLDQQLTEEERMVRDTAEQFAQSKLAPRVLEAFRHEKTDPAIFARWARWAAGRDHPGRVRWQRPELRVLRADRA